MWHRQTARYQPIPDIGRCPHLPLAGPGLPSSESRCFHDQYHDDDDDGVIDDGEDDQDSFVDDGNDKRQGMM